MRGTLTDLRDTTRIPLAPGPLEVVVPYSNPWLAAESLSAVAGWLQGFEAKVTLMAVHVLPYPAPLEAQAGIRKRLEAELATVARASDVSAEVRLAFARDRDQAFLGLLGSRSLVVVGTRERWWKTPEERLARKLAAHGHSVALVRIK
ncbi:MAG TPA: hypothetical protein VKR61_26470 [Bryobacteraceae bacterium]|nr:hypothetical protein [Bryobacteraceae bacterium]